MNLNDAVTILGLAWKSYISAEKTDEIYAEQDLSPVITPAGGQKTSGQIHLIRLTYVSKKSKDITTRIGEPYEIKNGKFYYFDHARNAIRSPLINNIVSMQVLEDVVTPKFV